MQCFNGPAFAFRRKSPFQEPLEPYDDTGQNDPRKGDPQGRNADGDKEQGIFQQGV